MRGIDRQLTGELNQLSGLILSALEKRAGEIRLATVASQNFAYALSALIFLLALAASFILKAMVDENERINRALRESAASTQRRCTRSA